MGQKLCCFFLFNGLLKQIYIKNQKRFLCSFVWCLSQIRKLSETTKKEVPMELDREGIFIYIMRNIKAITSQKLEFPPEKMMLGRSSPVTMGDLRYLASSVGGIRHLGIPTQHTRTRWE